MQRKAMADLQAKSLHSYRARFSPERCLRTSLSQYGRGEWIDDVPLYALRQAVSKVVGG